MERNGRYIGLRIGGPGSCGPSRVVFEEDGAETPLPGRNELVNHSPTGFEWGYGGSGPAQLAFAILCHHLGVASQVTPEMKDAARWGRTSLEVAKAEGRKVDPDAEKIVRALESYQHFKFSVIARLAERRWFLSSTDIEVALHAAEKATAERRRATV